MILFPLVALVFLSLMFWVPWKVIVRGLTENKKTLNIVKWAIITSIVLFLPAMYFGHAKHLDFARLYADFFIGILWITFVWSAIVGIIGYIVARIMKKDLKKPTAYAAIATTLAMLLLALYGGLKQPDINHETVKLSKLNPAMNGLKVAVIADTHFGPIPREAWMKEAVERLNAEHPDVVLFAGDIADGTAEQRKAEAAQLANVQAPYRGYVTGNHEYMEGALAWEQAMNNNGWTVLHNKNIEIEHNGGKLTVAGIDDKTAANSGIEGQGADIELALEGVNRDQPIILVAHQPKQVSDAVKENVDLQVSGHTHGGQIWPFRYLIPLDQPHVEGLKDINGVTQLFVTRGAGAWGPPMRLFAPSEINILTLESSK